MAWLTDIEWDTQSECYRLYFDFSDFEAINDKYFKEVDQPNYKSGYDEPLYTAKEVGYYSPKYSVLFSIPGELRNDCLFLDNICVYLKEAK